ncbi:MAG TPA: hypothetical protein VFJ61_13055 [Solirubrobacterales bacterium]|nr:hypothetical protein [Solirubrobacterales bacterium]
MKPRIRFVAVPVIACFALLLVPALATAATWIPPVDLATPSEFSAWEPRPEIAISGGGGGVAIWPQEQGLGTLKAAGMSLTGAWGAPVTLAHNEWGQRAEPELAMNEAGEAVAIWKHVGPEQSTIVAKVRAPSGDWGPQETLSPEGSPYGAFDIAVGPAGEAVAVWSQIPRFGSNSEYRIESSFMPAGGHWEPAVTLSDPEHESYSPQVAIAPNGRIVATFYGFLDEPENRPTIQVAEKQGGLWSPPQAISGASNAAFPKVEASTAGTAVVWEGIEGDERWIEAASRTTGGEWGQPVELSGPESFGPEIGADAAGTAVAIWNSFYGEEGDYVEGSTLPVGGNWSEPTAISGRVWLGPFTGARLAVAPNGHTLAAWSVWREPEPRVEQRLVEAASGSEGQWEEPTTLSAAKAWAVRPAVAVDGQGDGAVAWWAANPNLPQATEFVAPRPGATSGGSEPASSNNESSGSKRGRATADRLAFVRKGRVDLKLHCPGALACKGDLRLIARPTKVKGKATAVSAGSVDFDIPAGGKRTIAVRLNRKGWRLLSVAGKKGVGVRLVGNQIQRRGLLLRRAADQ